MSKKLPIGDEDTVTEIDTNADGKPDVRVITDNAPQQAIVTDATPTPQIPTEGPLGATDFDHLGLTAMDAGYRSMLDHPRHPLHHLAGA